MVSDSDFSIHCLPEDVIFAVQKVKLAEGSEVFSDMFSCCGDKNGGESRRSVDVYESANDIALLVQLLHNQLPAVPMIGTNAEFPTFDYGIQTIVIPYPLLPRLFVLAEKYVLTTSTMKALHSHLAAQAPVAPLLVYGLATQFSLPEIADEASAFLLSPPMETYSIDDIKGISSAEAYHKLLLLQNHRKLKMKDLLMNEELFPHGYGACAIHKAYAESRWDGRRERVLKNMNSGTDVAAKMAHRLDTRVHMCKVCLKAWVAATEMLAYKCQKVARRISQLPEEKL